jgi:hypothetical protein
MRQNLLDEIDEELSQERHGRRRGQPTKPVIDAERRSELELIRKDLSEWKLSAAVLGYVAERASAGRTK